MNLSDLQNRHEGETVWVLGSGATLNYYNPDFFTDKTCVFTNTVGYRLNLDQGYAFSHHWRAQKPAILGTQKMVHVVNAKEYPSLDPYEGDLTKRVILHTPNTWANSHSSFDPFGKDRPGEHQLVFGSTSGHGAMHLAAYMGAKSIVLVGFDVGLLDGETNVAGYPHQTHHAFADWNRHWIAMKHWVHETYGANTYSMIPFVNLNLEGHTFKGVA